MFPVPPSSHPARRALLVGAIASTLLASSAQATPLHARRHTPAGSQPTAVEPPTVASVASVSPFIAEITAASLELPGLGEPSGITARLDEADHRNARNRTIAWTLTGVGVASVGAALAAEKPNALMLSAAVFIAAGVYFGRSKGRRPIASEVLSRSQRWAAVK